ncbi:sigma-70 family RNA polymerase sigma factor [Emticicia sp. CRIBPO]|uniref:RNA polymerase sigma factor n=1 Tax=Emticicia sp. CRIBPO TaxID=2683258 RepID=UPI0014128AB1|nr:RNA polymerase sigma factor [Emticicia sp. CRIBPO]NBA86504.1 sigma-70 family RNA polymerase sigma factor [Emticicia sp. CRIBPO]
MKEQEIFEQLYSEYQDKIFRLCYGYARNPELASDLTQDCFIRVWENIRSFRNESSVSTWIYRIAVNNCLLYLRKNRSGKISFEYIDKDIPYQEDENANKEESIENLYRAIQKLQETERAIISMVLEDMSYKEIGDVMGISENSVGVKVHRIKRTLKNEL